MWIKWLEVRFGQPSYLSDSRWDSFGHGIGQEFHHRHVSAKKHAAIWFLGVLGADLSVVHIALLYLYNAYSSVHLAPVEIFLLYFSATIIFFLLCQTQSSTSHRQLCLSMINSGVERSPALLFAFESRVSDRSRSHLFWYLGRFYHGPFLFYSFHMWWFWIRPANTDAHRYFSREIVFVVNKENLTRIVVAMNTCTDRLPLDPNAFSQKLLSPCRFPFSIEETDNYFQWSIPSDERYSTKNFTPFVSRVACSTLTLVFITPSRNCRPVESLSVNVTYHPPDQRTNVDANQRRWAGNWPILDFYVRACRGDEYWLIYLLCSIEIYVPRTTRPSWKCSSRVAIWPNSSRLDTMGRQREEIGEDCSILVVGASDPTKWPSTSVPCERRMSCRVNASHQNSPEGTFTRSIKFWSLINTSVTTSSLFVPAGSPSSLGSAISINARPHRAGGRVMPRPDTKARTKWWDQKRPTRKKSLNTVV